MPSIADLAPELWHQIITTACTDGGFTGTSLTLTSRFFREQSFSNRFRSLAFTSLTSLEAFIAFADAQPKEKSPIRIHHLYLSFTGEVNSEPAALHPPLNVWLYWPAERLQQARGEHLASQEGHTQRFVSALTSLSSRGLTSAPSACWKPRISLSPLSLSTSCRTCGSSRWRVDAIFSCRIGGHKADLQTPQTPMEQRSPPGFPPWSDCIASAGTGPTPWQSSPTSRRILPRRSPISGSRAWPLPWGCSPRTSLWSLASSRRGWIGAPHGRK